MATTRPLALLAVTVTAGTVVALAGPAFSASIPVSLTGLGGTRQFQVENVSGDPLTAIDFGTGTVQPFRTHVQDSAFSLVTDANYQVDATLSNLYLRTAPSTYNYNVKVPSSDVEVNFGTNPLAATGLSLTDLPKLSLSSTLSSCVDLPTTLPGILTPLGLSGLGVPLSLTNLPLLELCSQLGASGAPLTAVVDATLQTITPAITSVLDLPTKLTGATGGAFTEASYEVGTVGAGDTAGAVGAPAATSVALMTGTSASVLSTNLANALLDAIDDALAGLPLTSTTGAGTKTQLASVITALTDTGNTAVAQALGNVLNTLTAANQVSVINQVFALAPVAVPTLADIASVTGDYYAFPILHATPTTPVAGTYDGTMTVTFVQS